MEENTELQESQAETEASEAPGADDRGSVTVVDLPNGIDSEIAPQAVQLELDFDQLLKLKDHRLEEKKHNFEVEKYIREERGKLASKGVSQTAKFMSQRTDLTFTALNVYRAGMGHEYRPPNVETMLEEFKLVWNTIYGLVHPMALEPSAGPAEPEGEEADPTQETQD